MNVLQKMQQAIVALSERTSDYETVKDTRRGLALLTRFFRRPGDDAEKNLACVMATARLHAEEVATWVGPEAIAAGRGGPFDACDLRIYLELAKRAGVTFIPATEILNLTEAEMSALSGTVELPERLKKAAAHRAVGGAALECLTEDDKTQFGSLDSLFDEPNIDAELLQEKLFAAMDDVPEGWMVRSALCGSSNLKALAGSGLAGPVAPEVKFGRDLEIGPGWIRRGNRRQVHVTDHRTMESYAQGPGGPLSFLARPWVEPARLIRCDDPHRAGTAFAGPGWWPVEIRAYIVDGVVTGCSQYYSWLDLPASPEIARLMMEARGMAQAVADEAKRQKAYPRFMDIEFIRNARHPSIAEDPSWRAKLDLFGREKVAFTLDFMEVKRSDGTSMLAILEGGPPASPVGGGHPTGFAGRSGAPTFGNTPDTNGVAFQSMAHIIIGDPRTWCPGEVTGRILTWAETEALAIG